MKTKAKLFSICFGMCSALSLNAHSATIFEDSFETGDMSATNAEGFSWGGNNKTSVVTQTADTPWCTISGPTAVYNGGQICNGPKVPAGGGDYIAKDGNFSLRFMYPAGQEWTEQRFDLGTPRTEVWIGFWLRVPTNFTYGAGSRRNNKFFAIWMDAYEGKGDGSTVWLGMEPYNNTGATLGFTYSNGQNTGSEGYKQHTPFITTADRGRWMQIIWHVKAESSDGANDGIVQTFRRWSNESSFTKLHETLNAPLRVPDAGPYGFKTGYILGWANAPYAENTEWLMDSFTISDSPLLFVQAAPKAPSALAVN
jgi:hypothetical protein